MAETNNLVQPLVNGKFQNTSTTTSTEVKETRGTTNLGKDAFLQLLVAEMQNQDPLEPSTNTEWISQLATFSQLEELQSLSATTENSQIFGLVGKQVVLSSEDADGNTIFKQGKVDFISYSGGKAQFSVNGNLYSMDNLYSIVDDDYYYNDNKPKITEKETTFDFNGNDPQDVSFSVDLGKDVAKATDVAIMIGDRVIQSDYAYLAGDRVVIKGELLNALEAGSYKFDVVFNDKNFTTVEKGITINVYNSHPKSEEETEGESGADVEKSDSDETVNGDLNE